MANRRITADTITDEQIRELRQSYSVQRINNLLGTNATDAQRVIAACNIALERPNPDARGTTQAVIAWRKARARCAEILNAREGHS